MIEICSNCGNYEWDKEIIENKLRCPKCGAEWEFKSLPLLILTGCSGVGKTTTAIEIMRRKVDFVFHAQWYCGLEWFGYPAL